MPWIFLTLLLANIACFIWGMMQDSSAPRVKIAVSEIMPADKRLLLLSERRDLGGAPLNAPGSATASATPVVSNGPVCYTVGPFGADSSPARLVERLTARHVNTRVDEEQNNSFDYWVFVPPQVDRARAEERQQELRRQGIEGTIVDEDPFSNAISLGHFAREDQAEALRGKMLAANVQAELRKIPKSGVESWVFVTAGAAKIDLGKAIDSAMAGNKEISKQPAPCET